MPPDAKAASQAEIAEALGLHRSTVRDHQRSGVIPKGATLEQAKSAYQAHMAKKEPLDLNEERARLAREQADRIAMDNAVRRGDLMPVDEVVAQWRGLLTNVRAKLLAIPHGLAPLLTGISDPAEAQRIVQRAIYDALREIVAAEGAKPSDGSGGGPDSAPGTDDFGMGGPVPAA